MNVIISPGKPASQVFLALQQLQSLVGCTVLYGILNELCGHSVNVFEQRAHVRVRCVTQKPLKRFFAVTQEPISSLVLALPGGPQPSSYKRVSLHVLTRLEESKQPI